LAGLLALWLPSETEGRDATGEPPTESLGLVLISLVAHDHLLLSGGEAVEVRELLLAGDRGDVAGGMELEFAKCVSIKDRR